MKGVGVQSTGLSRRCSCLASFDSCSSIIKFGFYCNMIFQSLSLPCDTVYIHINELYSKMASEREREESKALARSGAVGARTRRVAGQVCGGRSNKAAAAYAGVQKRTRVSPRKQEVATAIPSSLLGLGCTYNTRALRSSWARLACTDTFTHRDGVVLCGLLNVSEIERN